MKFVLFVIAIVALLWLLKRSWHNAMPPSAAPPEPAPPKALAPQSMLACAHCGVHLPADETWPGRGGVFCGEPHRTAYEQAHPT